MFRSRLRKFVAVYLDDMLVYSNTLAEHLRHLRTVLEILKANSIKCNPSKCVIGVEEVKYLGHVVEHVHLRVDPAKVAKILATPAPSFKSEASTFLSMTLYLASYLSHY